LEYWYALYTKPHNEHHVSSFLESRGFETYLPTIQVKKNGKSKTFFSCYLFVRLDPAEALARVRWAPGLRRKQMEASGYPVEQHFKPGERVLIKSGPLLHSPDLAIQAERAYQMRLHWDTRPVSLRRRPNRCTIMLPGKQSFHRRRQKRGVVGAVRRWIGNLSPWSRS